MLEILEGSRAVAEAVRLCRPGVISAYPITPQTHIVEELSQMVADGDLKSEYVRVESEHSAASVVLGASATGARAYSATTSQGLLLMVEVLFNIAGMRLPVVITCVNRSVSAPLNIWNDQQDSVTVRDAGIIQLYAEDNQEALDMHIQAFGIAEDHRVLLPVMVCLDGFVLSHTYEPVDVPSEELVDAFLPPYDPLYYLDPSNPMTLGAHAGPELYHEIRYQLDQATRGAKEVVIAAAREFSHHFDRPQGELVEAYRCEDADTVFVAMGSVIGTLKDTVDALREEGERAGVLKVRCYRPFPSEEIAEALADAARVVVLEKAVSMGGEGILAADLRSALYGRPQQPPVHTAVIGLGGRDVTPDTIREALSRARAGERDFFAGLRQEVLED